MDYEIIAKAVEAETEKGAVLGASLAQTTSVAAAVLVNQGYNVEAAQNFAKQAVAICYNGVTEALQKQGAVLTTDARIKAASATHDEVMRSVQRVLDAPARKKRDGIGAHHHN